MPAVGVAFLGPFLDLHGVAKQGKLRFLQQPGHVPVGTPAIYIRQHMGHARVGVGMVHVDVGARVLTQRCDWHFFFMYLEKEKQQSELDGGLVVVGIRRVYLGVARPESGLGQCLGAAVVQFVSLAPSEMVAIRAGVAGVGVVRVGNDWGSVGKRSLVNVSSF